MIYRIHRDQRASALQILECPLCDLEATYAIVSDWLNDHGQERITCGTSRCSAAIWCLPHRFVRNRWYSIGDAFHTNFRTFMWRAISLSGRYECLGKPAPWEYLDFDCAPHLAKIIRRLPLDAEKCVFRYELEVGIPETAPA